MADQSAQQLFQKAVVAARQGDLPAARKLIQAAIRKDPKNATAWLVFASVAESKREKLLALKKALELDPQNAQAHKMARSMGISPDQLLKAGTQPLQPDTDAPDDLPTPPPAKPRPGEIADAKPTTSGLFSFQQEAADDEPAFPDEPQPAFTPLSPEDTADDAAFADAADVDAPPTPAQTAPPPPSDQPPAPPPRAETFEERLLQIRDEIDEIVAGVAYLPPLPDNRQWAKKDKNRAGENEIVLVRLALVTTLMVTVGIPLTIIGVILWNTPFVQSIVRGDDDGIFRTVATHTPTPTPQFIPTETPGFTATPSPSASPIPENAGLPTITPTPPVLLVQGQSEIGLIAPTEVVMLGGESRPSILNSVAMVDNGEYDTAIATLQVIRQPSEDTKVFVPEVYYTEAVAYARQGEFETALELLEEGEQLRQEQTRAEAVVPVAYIQTGFATVYLEQGKQALEAGQTGQANQFFSQAERSAQAAIDVQDQWIDPRLILIDSHMLRGNDTAALTALDEAQAMGIFEADVRLMVRRAEVNFRQEDYDQAEYNLYVALYVDAFSAPAHALRTRLALAQGKAAETVQAAQAYLYYHPLVVSGWEMLGDARMLEDKPNLALEAYTQAIVVGENVEEQPAPVDAYVKRANIYEARGQYALALADIAKATAATDDPELKRREMYLRYAVGEYEQARQLAELLRGSGGISEGEANLMTARTILAKRDTPTTGDYAEAASLIDAGFGSIPEAMQPLANTLRAEAYLGQGSADTALGFANSALNGGETARRRLVRGDIYAAQGQYADAMMEYQRVLTLDQIAGIPEDIRQAALESIADTERELRQFKIDATATAAAQ